MFSKVFTFAGLASTATAHMIMADPVPYGLSSLTNAPLLADGTDYPCKLRTGAFDSEGASNVFAQGSSQKLSFKGTAVHGGGSCQISITTDLEPTKNSKFKVIKSIEGGCPAKNQAGNMGDNADAIDPYTYDYTIPKDLAAGNYTLAWSWFNKIGNREMYMNCAPLTVTGSSGSESALDSLPDMFVANIGIDGCGTVDSSDLLFPNPGLDVDKFNGNTDAFSAPTSCAAATGGGDSGATTSLVSIPTTSAAAENGNGNGASSSAPGGVFITVSDTPAATTAAPVATTAVVSNPPVATSTANPGNDNGSSSTFSAGTACTDEGEWNCIGGNSFQRCASGAWTEVQQLSSGVSCTPGQSSDMALSAKRATLNMRRAVRQRV